MSRDPSTVTLTVLASQAELVETLISPGYEDFEISEDSHLTALVFHEVGYGELPFLGKLQAAGIAYDSSWSAGSEYTPGTKYLRFTPEGTVISREIYDDQVNPNLDELLKRIDKPAELKAYLLAHADHVSVEELLEEQIEFGKRYRATNLIAPT